MAPGGPNFLGNLAGGGQSLGEAKFPGTAAVFFDQPPTSEPCMHALYNEK